MASKRLPTLPFLPQVPASVVTPHYAGQLNLAINSIYRNIVAEVDGKLITATASSLFPSAQGMRRLAFDGSTLYIDWNTTSWTPISGGGGGTLGTYIVEVLAGACDSSNLVFTASHTPVHGEQLMVNEAVMIPGTHYTRVGATITFVAGQAPDDGDIVVYRYYY